ncbi:hypothetical protein C2G38_2205778 [Gigaspora rosea]|uniref:histidine kinase n=1 Tax=Gigaspora rosea TaxID=44941 RepID=A0A397UN23_9GLOM|nr:hypothetical protein C2G38_2205778 [Gigaspora rosea]
MSLPLDYSGNIENEKQAYTKMVYNYDWSSTVLGPIDSWDPALKNALNMCLHSAFPAYLCIYPDWISIYNPAWNPIFKAKSSYQQGKPLKETWPEVYEVLNSQFESVRISRKGTFFNDFCYAVQRDGYEEDIFFKHGFSPVIQSDGTVCAIFFLGQETTQNVLSARRLKTLNEFSRRISEVTSLENACQIITKVLSNNNADIPYALIYFVDHKSNSGSDCSIASLIATTFDYDDKTGWKFPDYLPETLKIIDLAKDANKIYDTYIELKRYNATYSFLKCDSWPISLSLKEGDHIKVLLKDDSQAVLLLTKISIGEGRVLSTILICGINPRCTLDEKYMEFLKVCKTSHLLPYCHADLNRQKVSFFQGLSHELKTPLTLMLSPLDDIITTCPKETPMMSHLQLIRRQELSAILICGINPRCTLDEKYMEFLKLTVSHMNTFLLHAKTVEEEKMRSKVLADLNRQKVSFFQGLSHELKTPLTLMLSPLDDIITICSKEASMMSHLQLIRRNSHRLLKLINSLLQFSNIEANKLKVDYRETNITEFTQELVSNFKNMAETLGLEYVIDIPSSDKFNQAMGDKIYLDHDMYETIVFNLCSNALKHTWKGRVTIRLYLDHKDNKKMVVLEISDTGVGIPEKALPNLFQRFYRVESQNSRSHEGTGIGLALVKELITCHGGDITVTSVVNQGTTFKCWFPIGHEHLSANQITNQISFENPIVSGRELYNNRQLYLEESSQWIINNTREVQNDIIDNKLSIDDQDMDIDKILADDIVSHDSTVNAKKYQILLVDDNNDMRDYLADLLNEFDVFRACDGQDAIRVLKKLKKLPDLILSGLDKGADDYLVKPFSAQELITRIRTNIELSILRRKISFQQSKQEETKQLLLSISNKILSGLDLNETMLNIFKEIHHRLPIERIFIVTSDQSGFKNNKIIGLYEDEKNITPMTNQSIKFNDSIKDKSQTLTNLQESLDNYPGIDVFLDVYCDNACKNVSLLSAEIRLGNICWGWIKVHRSPNSVWLDFEIELLQQMSNQISLAITYAHMLEENAANEIKIKTAEAASMAKSQILANTSHELRTPLGAIIGILSTFENTSLTADQREMINIMSCGSDIVLSIVNDILDVARLEAQKITLANTTFDLLELFENTIESFGKKAGTKRIELIVNCEVDKLPRYIKSDPERIKFTNEGKIIVTISMQLQDVIDEDKNKQTYGQTIKKGNFIDQKYIKQAWQSYSQSDMSMTKTQDGTGLGLSICKSLVEINGGEIDVESQLGKGSKFWFTWNIELLSMISSLSNTTQFGQISYVLPHVIKKKRILIIHPLEDTRNALLNYFKAVKNIDAFDSFDEGISATKSYRKLHNQSAYDVALIGLYKDNEQEVMKATLELRGLEMNNYNLTIIFIVFPNNEENELAEKLIRKVGGIATILHTPITWKKLTNQIMNMKTNTLQQVSKLGYSTISATNGLEAPLMSGSDISQAIRAMKPPISNIPIIVLTALPVEEIQNKCIESGMNDYFANPLKTEELEKILNKWISKKLD